MFYLLQIEIKGLIKGGEAQNFPWLKPMILSSWKTGLDKRVIAEWHLLKQFNISKSLKYNVYFQQNLRVLGELTLQTVKVLSGE